MTTPGKTACAAASGLVAAVLLGVLGPAGCSARPDLQPDDHPLQTTVPAGTPSTLPEALVCYDLYVVNGPGSLPESPRVDGEVGDIGNGSEAPFL